MTNYAEVTEFVETQTVEVCDSTGRRLVTTLTDAEAAAVLATDHDVGGVCLKLMTAGRNPCTLTVTYSKDRSGRYYGRISAAGVNTPAGCVPAGLTAFLDRLAADPEWVTAGYGLVCAKNYNLPYGKRAAAKLEAIA